MMGSFQVDVSSPDSSMTEPEDENTPFTQTRHSRSRISGSIQVVEFLIGDERFAIDLFDTREVITTPEVTPIPSAPHYITGMIDLRGVITIIIDLKKLMQITRDTQGRTKSRIIILDKEVSEKRIGILVDDVTSVTTYTKDEIDIDTHTSSKSARDILGVIRKHRKNADGKETSSLVLWLDIKGMIGKIQDFL